MSEHPGLERLREMHQKATALPWPADYVSAAVRHIARNCDFIESETSPEFGWDRYSDAGLIVTLRNVVPELVALIEKAQNASDAMDYVIDHNGGGGGGFAGWKTLEGAEDDLDAALSALLDALAGGKP